MRSIALALVAAVCACTSTATPELSSAPPSTAIATPSRTATPTASATSAPAASALVSAGIAPDAGVLFINGPDDRIYRYEGATGTLSVVSAASVFASERLDGVLIIGTHGSADLLRWDGTTQRSVCGDGIVIAIATTGACAYSGDGADQSVYVRLPGETARRQLLPGDWRAGGLVWDPSGTRIALTRSLGGPDLATRLHDALWVIDADGTPHELYRPSGAFAFVYSLRWSPDGRFITALQQPEPSASFEMDGLELLLIEVATARVTSLGRVLRGWYRWSEDGRLAFVSGGGRETWIGKQLMLRERDGTIVPVSPAGRVGLAPAWAPVGGQLAWIDAPEGDAYTDRAYVNGVGPGARRGSTSPGTGIGRIDCGDRAVEGVRWSADGALLLLCRRVGDVSHPLELWLRRFGTTGPELVPLVTGLGDDVLRGFGVYGAHPSLFGLVAWSKAVADPRPQLRPTGFVLPSACAYVWPGTPSGQRTLWQIDCGVAGRHDARGLLGGALAAQGWSTCGPAAATQTWIKDEWALSVSEASGDPISYIGLSESPRRIVSC